MPRVSSEWKCLELQSRVQSRPESEEFGMFGFLLVAATDIWQDGAGPGEVSSESFRDLSFGQAVAGA